MTLDERLWRVTTGVPEHLPSEEVKHLLHERWKDCSWLPDDMRVLHQLGINFLSSEEQASEEITRRKLYTEQAVAHSAIKAKHLQFLVFQVELDFLVQAAAYYKNEPEFVRAVDTQAGQALIICNRVAAGKDCKKLRATLQAQL